MAPEALAALRRYGFPGNVRELENAMEHAFVMCHGDEIQSPSPPGHHHAGGGRDERDHPRKAQRERGHPGGIEPASW
jgi:DNA-binding NtrC family response regulator